MNDRIDIPPNGGTRVHVFELDLDGVEAARFVARTHAADGRWPLRDALGADYLDSAHIDHFPVSDLTGIGLEGYLREGLGLDESELLADRDRLAGVTQDVVILRPAAVAGTAQTLTPRPPLRHVGSYVEAQAATTMERLHADAATGGAAEVAPGPAPGRTPRSLKILAIAATVIIVLGLVLLLAGLVS